MDDHVDGWIKEEYHWPGLEGGGGHGNEIISHSTETNGCTVCTLDIAEAVGFVYSSQDPLLPKHRPDCTYCCKMIEVLWDVGWGGANNSSKSCISIRGNGLK